MKFSYSKNPEKDFYIKTPNLTKKNSDGWEGRGWGVARVSEFSFRIQVWKKIVFSF